VVPSDWRIKANGLPRCGGHNSYDAADRLIEKARAADKMPLLIIFLPNILDILEVYRLRPTI